MFWAGKMDQWARIFKPENLNSDFPGFMWGQAWRLVSEPHSEGQRQVCAGALLASQLSQKAEIQVP